MPTTPLIRLHALRLLATTGALSLVAILALSARLSAQLAPTAPAPDVTEEPPIELSPFVISTSSDVGYSATSTLAGSRLKTDFKDVAAQISVMTEEFLRDVSAFSAEEAFIYSTNIEGPAEFSGNQFFGNSSFTSKANTRSRGLASATTSRNFFNSQIRQDSYNTGDGGITVASGPNAILFGLGSPAGMIDTRLNRAQFTPKGRFRFRTDNHGSQRAELDTNIPLVRHRLAARFDALYDNKKFAFEPAFDFQKRLFGTVGYTPFSKLRTDVSAEYLTTRSSRPAYFLPKDSVSLWFNPAVGNRQGWRTGNSTAASTAFAATNNPQPTYVFGTGANAPVVMNTQGSATIRSIGSYLLGNNLLPSSYDTYTDNTLSDETYYPVKRLSLYGDSHLTKANAKNITFSATLHASENLFFEVAAMYERFSERTSNQYRNVQANLNVDPNLFVPGSTTVANPNFGKFYVEGQAQGFASEDFDKEIRASVAYTLDAQKRFSSSFLQRWLGRHNLVGLASTGERQRLGQTFARLVEDYSDGTAPSIITANAAKRGGSATFMTNDNRKFRTRQYIDANDSVYRYARFGNLDPFEAWTFTDPANNRTYRVTLFDGTGSDNSPSGRRFASVSKALAYQGYFLRDRLVLTLGKRWDDIETKQLDSDLRRPDPSTGLSRNFTTLPWERYQSKPTFKNDTKSAVVHPFRWLSFHYNQSTNNDTASASHNINGDLNEATTGVGKDYGFRVAYAGLSLRVNRYQSNNENTDAGNQINSLRDNISTVENRYQALNPGGQPFGKTATSEGYLPASNTRDYYRVLSDNVSKGDEIELGGRFQKLDVRITIGRTRAVKSNIGSDWLDYVIKRQPVFETMKWYDTATGLPVIAYNPSTGTRTLGTAGATPLQGWRNIYLTDNGNQSIYSYYVNTLMANTYYRTIKQNGRTNDTVREWRYNATFAYQFTRDLRAGLSIRYRDQAAIGYATKTDNLDILGAATPVLVTDLERPLYTPSFWYFDPFVSYTVRVTKKARAILQLNVANLLNTDDIYPVQAYSTPLDTTRPQLATYTRGAYAAFSLQEPRLVNLSVTVHF